MREPAELAALADGSLAPDRRAALEARVAASPELADLLAEQERAVALARSAAAEVEAPPACGRASKRSGAPRVARRRRVASPSRGAAVAVASPSPSASAVFGSGTPAERFRAALAPTGLAPGATGEATLTKTASGWRIELRRRPGCPAATRARFYEAWLRNAAGVLVPIGTFNEGRNVTLWAGVSPKDFTTLTVTREQADGDQALVRREGARRHRRHRRLAPTSAVDAAHDLLPRAVEAAHHGPLADPRAPAPPPCTRGR